MRGLLLALLLLAATPASAQAPFRLPEGERMHVVTRGLGWTVLRDVAASRDAAEPAMLLIRAQRPVPPASRPGHLARTLEGLRPYRVTAVRPSQSLQLAGLPAETMLAEAVGRPSGVPLIVQAVCLYARERSWLLVASAPAAQWHDLEPEMTRLIQGFQPG